jgi:sorting nexin-1/2
LIELWETYLLQLDSDEDGPPLMPAGVRAEASEAASKIEQQGRREVASAEEAARQRQDDEGTPSLSGTTAIEGEESVRASEDTAHEIRTGDVEG